MPVCDAGGSWSCSVSGGSGGSGAVCRLCCGTEKQSTRSKQESILVKSEGTVPTSIRWKGEKRGSDRGAGWPKRAPQGINDHENAIHGVSECCCIQAQSQEFGKWIPASRAQDTAEVYPDPDWKEEQGCVEYPQVVSRPTPVPRTADLWEPESIYETFLMSVSLLSYGVSAAL
ncbi:hypothetical protein NDU88_000068 [Pleurodeles waltl]|uniref:Uncharacterized protein n=1 Tax=Pleurodeles waltl TaxID=8319 RepID=A0AAV7S3H9_PLEWA|nr:hypothetical protein NDU88_000068 [Pleurodeles waltl]